MPLGLLCEKRRGWRRWEWNKKQKHKRCHQLHLLLLRHPNFFSTIHLLIRSFLHFPHSTLGSFRLICITFWLLFKVYQSKIHIRCQDRAVFSSRGESVWGTLFERETSVHERETHHVLQAFHSHGNESKSRVSVWNTLDIYSSSSSSTRQQLPSGSFCFSQRGRIGKNPFTHSSSMSSSRHKRRHKRKEMSSSPPDNILSPLKLLLSSCSSSCLFLFLVLMILCLPVTQVNGYKHSHHHNVRHNHQELQQDGYHSNNNNGNNNHNHNQNLMSGQQIHGHRHHHDHHGGMNELHQHHLPSFVNIDLHQ